MKSPKIIPLILCGGKGSRLWPLSRNSYPKQFLDLVGEDKLSLLQETYQRISSLENVTQPILICNEEHRFIVAEQMREINVNPSAIILEETGRNTAPAISLGSIFASETIQDSVLLVLSSDHVIKNNYEFMNCIYKGSKYAQEGKLVTFGVIPTHPETGYGYIEGEKEFNQSTLEGINIKNFIEKPDSDKALKLFNNKRYTWNSGIFMFRPEIILKELSEYEPLVVKYAEAAMKNKRFDLDFCRIDNHFFSKSPSLSIDVAVMERTDLGIVLPFNAGWSDIGSWQSLWKIDEKDNKGNVVKGNVIDKDSRNCLLLSENRLLVTIGLNELIVVETTDALFVSDKENANNIKEIVQSLETKGYKESYSHRKVHRPWGNYISIAEGDGWQVKRIEVKPNSKLSLQMHNHRAEHWVVVSGQANVELNDRRLVLKKNQSMYVPLGIKHRLANFGVKPLILIEVQSGDYLGEDDIVRFDDEYGRHKSS